MFQLYNEPTNDYHAKLVLKPLSPERKWKFIYEPLHQEVRVLSKKIPLTRFLNLQVLFLSVVVEFIIVPSLVSFTYFVNLNL